MAAASDAKDVKTEPVRSKQCEYFLRGMQQCSRRTNFLSAELIRCTIHRGKLGHQKCACGEIYNARFNLGSCGKCVKKAMATAAAPPEPEDLKTRLVKMYEQYKKEAEQRIAEEEELADTPIERDRRLEARLLEDDAAWRQLSKICEDTIKEGSKKPAEPKGAKVAALVAVHEKNSKKA